MARPRTSDGRVRYNVLVQSTYKPMQSSEPSNDLSDGQGSYRVCSLIIRMRSSSRNLDKSLPYT